MGMSDQFFYATWSASADAMAMLEAAAKRFVAFTSISE